MKKYKLWLLLAWLILLVISLLVPRVNALSPAIEVDIPSEIKGDLLKEYAYVKVANYWDITQWDSFEKIIDKESSWTVTKEHNPKLSSAYGLAGFLDSTWESVDCIKSDDPYTQIDCGIKYILKRYGYPKTALVYHLKHNYY